MTYSATSEAERPCQRCGSERQRVTDGDFERARGARRELGPGDHAVLVHDEAAAVAPVCARFFAEGAARGDRVFGAVPDDLRQAVMAELPAPAAGKVEWEEPNAFYADFDADRIVATYEALVLEEARPARILAGLDRRSAEDVAPEEMARYEALAHELINSLGASVLCVYEADALGPELVEVGMRRHGLVIEGDGARRNDRFEYAPV